jgi:hypothetical protein
MPRRRRFGRRFWLRLLLSAAGLYLVILALAFAFQDRLIFPGAGQIEPILPAGTERLTMHAPDGVRLAGIRIPAEKPGSGAPVILSFPGNATNAADAALQVHRIFPDADVIGFHYRGYPPSGGRTSTTALRADALLERDFAARRFAGRPVVAIGFSIGSGLAAWVAHNRPLAGLILVTPFDSLAAVAADRTPWLPVGLLMRGNLDSAAWLRGNRLPVAIVAAGRDRLVLPARTEALRHALANRVFDRTIPSAGHNDIYGDSGFDAAMAGALAAVIAGNAAPKRARPRL